MDKKRIESRLTTFLAELKERRKEDIPGDAYFTMKRIEEVDVDHAFSIVNSKIQKRSQKTRTLHLLQRIAAVLFLPLLAASIFLYSYNRPSYSENVKQTISNPSGVRSQVELPDGSIVWLNSGTEISYNNPFSKNKREVELSGEAYFDVKSNPEIPFSVIAGQVSVQVLGTRFNVKCYQDEQNIEVSLEEGKINLATQQGKEQQLTELVPGMRAVYNVQSKKTLFSQEENIDKYSAWQKGKLVFDDTPFPQVVTTLKRWYSVNIDIMNDEIRQYKLTTTFEDQAINQVIKLLELSSPIIIDHKPVELDENGQIKAKPQITIYKK